MIKLKLLLSFLLLTNCAIGQVKNEVELSRAPDLKSPIKSLKIGDKVPELLISIAYTGFLGYIL
jgi:hypothetical protein